jgi:hypothetical protein
MPTNLNPPRPHLALRIGVTGHRLVRLHEPDIDADAVRVQVQAILGEIHRVVVGIARDFASVYTAPPLLRLISPLAEGTDQLVADTALEMGYQLHVPLPCLPALYTSGFQRSAHAAVEEPRAAFDRLLARAESVQVLDGRPSAALDSEAYAAVGRTVLRHSDILIAVWDRTPAEGPGGTGDVVRQARDWHVPVVVIDPRAPTQWHLEDESGASLRGDVAALVRRILSPPAHDSDEDGHARRKERSDEAAAAADVAAPALIEYLHTRPSGHWGGIFSALVALCTFESPFRAPVRLGYQCIVRARANWDAIWARPTPLDRVIVDPISHLLREYFAWADGLADRFGIAHRDASVAPYVLAPLTIIVAIVAQIALAREHANQVVQALVEFSILGLNLFFYEAAVRAGYHERWIDYRSLAEELRHLAYLWPLGRPLRSANLVGEAATEATHFAWVGWYGRAIGRQGGLYPCVFTPDRLDGFRTMLVEHFLRPQCQYHGRTQTRFRKVQERLHGVTLWLFRIAFLLAAIDVVVALVFKRLPPSQTPLSEVFGWGVLAAALAMILPYVATGTHGFLSQGDFWNLSRRSERMCQQLEPLMSKISLAPVTLESLGNFAEDAADVMRDEVLNWRVFVRLKPPAL